MCWKCCPHYATGLKHGIVNLSCAVLKQAQRCSRPTAFSLMGTKGVLLMGTKEVLLMGSEWVLLRGLKRFYPWGLTGFL